MLWPGASWATESAIPTPAATVASAAHRTAKEASRWVFGPCKGAPRRRSSGGRRTCRVEASAGAGGGARCVPRGSAFARSTRRGSAGGAGAAPARPSSLSPARRASGVRLRAQSGSELPTRTGLRACRPEAGAAEAAEAGAAEAVVVEEAAAAVGPRSRRPCRACCGPEQRSSRRTFRPQRTCVETSRWDRAAPSRTRAKSRLRCARTGHRSSSTRSTREPR